MQESCNLCLSLQEVGAPFSGIDSEAAKTDRGGHDSSLVFKDLVDRLS